MIGDFLAGNFLAHTVNFGDFMAGDFMAGNFLARNFIAHRVTIRDFMATHFLAGDFLGWIHLIMEHIESRLEVVDQLNRVLYVNDISFKMIYMTASQ